jgi:tetratricopeptide (TPR) repeat protein
MATGARLAGICALLVAMTWIVFGQTLRFPFITFDDEVYVYENRAVLSGLTLHGIHWAFTHVVDANWHPLTVISHMLDCSIFGLNAGGHHFTNVLLHSIAVAVFFLVLQNMTGSVWRSAFTAALFAIHPLHVESVAWISERKDILSGLFFFLTIGAYVRYVRARSIARYLPVFCLFAIGLMCKPMLVTLPVVLLLIDYWPLRQLTPAASPKTKATKSAAKSRGTSQKLLFLEKLPLLGLSALSCVATLIAQERTIAAMNKLPMTSRIANAVVSILVYLRQMFDPTHLALLYPHPNRSLPFGQIFVSLSFIVGITLLVWVLRASRPYLLMGWLWYLVMLAPVIGIVQVGLQAHADRYTYLPHIGLYLMVTWLATDLSKSWPRRATILTTASVLVLLALTATAHQQTSLWSDTIKLWAHAAEVSANNDTAHAALSALYLKRGQVDEALAQAQLELKIRPDSDEGHSRLGIALFRKGQLDGALAEFQKVARLRPDYPDLHSNMATVLVEKGRVDEAIAEYRRELASPQEREDANDLSHDPGGAEHRDEALLHNNFGAVLARKGRFEEALEQFGQVLAINPEYPKVHYNIGNVAMQKGDFDKAMVEYQHELRIQPGYALAHADLGIVLSQKGLVREAVAEWQKVLAFEPNNLNAACNLAWVLATHTDGSIRDGIKAVELAEHAVNLSGGTNPRILRLLAAAYAETGRFAQAIEVAQRAAQLAREQNNPDLAETLQRNVVSFQANQPLRD